MRPLLFLALVLLIACDDPDPDGPGRIPDQDKELQAYKTSFDTLEVTDVTQGMSIRLLRDGQIQSGDFTSPDTFVSFRHGIIDQKHLQLFDSLFTHLPAEKQDTFSRGVVWYNFEKESTDHYRRIMIRSAQTQRFVTLHHPELEHSIYAELALRLLALREKSKEKPPGAYTFTTVHPFERYRKMLNFTTPKVVE